MLLSNLKLKTKNLELIIPLALLAPFLVGCLPGFGFNNYTYSLLNLGLAYVLVVLGLNLLTGYAGQISLGHSGLLAIGAYSAAGLVGRGGWPFWVGAVAAMGITTLAGLLLALPALRLSGPYLALVTVGFSVAVPQLLKFLDFRTDGVEGLTIPQPNLPGLPAEGDLSRYYLYLLPMALVYWLLANLRCSGTGRAWLALRDNETAAQALGINLTRSKLLAFSLSAALTGLAGALYAGQLGRVGAEQFNLLQSIQFVVMITVGGLGSQGGAVVGALLLTFLPELLNRLSEWLQTVAADLHLKNPQYVLYGLLIIAFVLYAPDGLAGRLGKLGRFRQKVRPAPLAAPLEPPNLTPTLPPTELRLEGVTMRFGGLTALDDLSLEVMPGQITGLIGPNGAGKTTAFNCLSRFYRPQKGHIWWGNREISRLSAHKLAGLGIVRTFQNGALFGSLNVLDNLLVGQHCRLKQSWFAALLSLPKVRREERAARHQALAVLDWLGLAEIAEQPVKDLPFGTQKLVELARALVSQPALLLLDEPATGLNETETAHLTGLLRRLQQDYGLTILLIEHAMAVVMPLCQHLYVLDFGRLLASGVPDEIQSHQAVIEAYLGLVTQSDPSL